MRGACPFPSLLRISAWLLLGASALAQTPLKIGGRFLLQAAERGPDGQALFYEAGAPKTPEHQLLLTSKVRVRGRNLNAASLQQRSLAKSVRQIGSHWIVEFSRAESALSGAKRLAKLATVDSAEPIFARQWQPKLIPNDPYFTHDERRSGYQWHLRNTGQRLTRRNTALIDLNVSEVWDTQRGNGVVIGIVDDGLQIDHPDLQPNLLASLCRDFNFQDADPSPGADDPHGTSCAGVAAARGNNGIGGCGVAPEANLAGLRLIAGPSDDEDEAAALGWKNDQIHIKSNSWGPGDDAYGASGPGPMAAAALQQAVKLGRGGRGTVFLWAGGNGNRNGDDSNYDGWANSPCVIAVGALGDDEREAPYSEPGSNLLVCAPSNGGAQGITTTDLIGGQGYAEGEYTSDFGGTSSATPAVAGVVALMLAANPRLGWRDVQEILVRSASKIDEYDGDWVTNGAGFHFHHHYGAGLVNAQAAVSLSRNWTALGASVTRSISDPSDVPIPDKGRGILTRNFTVIPSNNMRLEHVQVKVKATHTYRGQLEWWLVSPSGVRSRLARARNNDSGEDLDWTFCTTHHWGEWSQGIWSLMVEDIKLGHSGTLTDVSITFQGTAVSSVIAPACVFTSPYIIVGREDAELRHQITASNSPQSFLHYGLPSGLSMSSSGLITGTPVVDPDNVIIPAVLEVRNAADQATQQNAIFYFLAADPMLSEALDVPESTKLVPFGYGTNWFLQSRQTKDGIDAAQSAAIDHREHSGMEFTLRGPCSLQFSWKVSSEEDYDYLVFTLDGEVEEIISGETDWQVVQRQIPEGIHRANLYYLKDAAKTAGQDAGFVDAMSIEAVGQAPVVESETIQVYDSQWVERALKASNAPDRWDVSNLPAGLELDSAKGILLGRTGVSGVHEVSVTASNRFGSSPTTLIRLSVGSIAAGLSKAIDPSGQVASTLRYAGDASWNVQDVFTKDGSLAARSGSIDDLQRSEMSCEVTGPGRLQFYWAVSSEEDCDYLTFEINGQRQDRISGEVLWKRCEYFLSEGRHQLRWVYSKDNYVREGLDAGFVDALSLSQDNDLDGHWSDEEEAFGSSDLDERLTPRVELLTQDGRRTLRFSSVAGRDYQILYGPTHGSKKATLRATGNFSLWQDPADNATAPLQQLYQIIALPQEPAQASGGN